MEAWGSWLVSALPVPNITTFLSPRAPNSQDLVFWAGVGVGGWESTQGTGHFSIMIMGQCVMWLSKNVCSDRPYQCSIGLGFKCIFLNACDI